jgi:hypothetical protein
MEWLGLRMLVSVICCWQVLLALPTAIAASETCGGQLMVRLSAVGAASQIPVGWLLAGVGWSWLDSRQSLD